MTQDYVRGRTVHVHVGEKWIIDHPDYELNKFEVETKELQPESGVIICVVTNPRASIAERGDELSLPVEIFDNSSKKVE